MHQIHETPYGVKTEKRHPYLSYLLGVLKGDGSFYADKSTGTYAIELQAKDLEFVEAFRYAAVEIVRRPDSPYREPSIFINGRKLYRVVIRSKSFGKWYLNPNNDAFREAIINKHPNQYLRAVYDSDGNYDKINDRIRIFKANPESIASIESCLKTLGINYLTTIEGKIGQITNKGPRKQSLYQVAINRKQDVKAFMWLVGSNIPRKQMNTCV